MIAMQRPNVLIAPGREDARTEHRRTWQGGWHCGAGSRPLSSSEWLVICSVGEYDSILTPEDRKPFPTEQSSNPLSAKVLYLEAMQAQVRDRFQETWGRVQQKGEMEYEPFVAFVAALKRLRARLSAETRTVLEEFVGFVDQIDADVAYITLKPQTGEALNGEYPAAELNAKGIYERRYFKCRTIEAGSHVEFDLEPIPDRELSEERERAIEDRLRKSLGDDDGPQDDY
jgi:hypothetical protein